MLQHSVAIAVAVAITMLPPHCAPAGRRRQQLYDIHTTDSFCVVVVIKAYIAHTHSSILRLLAKLPFPSVVLVFPCPRHHQPPQSRKALTLPRRTNPPGAGLGSAHSALRFHPTAPIYYLDVALVKRSARAEADESESVIHVTTRSAQLSSTQLDANTLREFEGLHTDLYYTGSISYKQFLRLISRFIVKCTSSRGIHTIPTTTASTYYHSQNR